MKPLIFWDASKDDPVDGKLRGVAKPHPHNGKAKARKHVKHAAKAQVVGVRRCNLSRSISTHVEGHPHDGHLGADGRQRGCQYVSEGCQDVSDTLDMLAGVSQDDTPEFTEVVDNDHINTPEFTEVVDDDHITHQVEAMQTVLLLDEVVILWKDGVRMWMILMSTLVHMVLVQLYRA